MSQKTHKNRSSYKITTWIRVNMWDPSYTFKKVRAWKTMSGNNNDFMRCDWWHRRPHYFCTLQWWPVLKHQLISGHTRRWSTMACGGYGPKANTILNWSALRHATNNWLRWHFEECPSACSIMCVLSVKATEKKSLNQLLLKVVF